LNKWVYNIKTILNSKKTLFSSIERHLAIKPHKRNFKITP
jgi:hypothetical protein